MTRFLQAIAFALLAAAGSPAAEAYVFHGALGQASGEPLPADGRTVALTFRLYAQPTGGDPLWEEGQTLTCDAQGNFVAPLGDAVPGLEAVFAGARDALYLGLSVNGGAELAPRQRLLSVPMAHRAKVAAHAYADFPIAGTATAGTLATDTLSAGRLAFRGGSGETPSLEAESVEAKGAVEVTGDVEVGGRASLPQGLRAPVFAGYAAALPGMILPWCPPSPDTPVPEGWALCDGTNGTPNLNGRFPVGAGGAYAVGATGGEDAVTLGAAHLPPHSHTFSYVSGAKMYNYKWADVNSHNAGHDSDNIWTNAYDTPDVMVSKTTSSAGGGAAHENRPPFFALRFIMRRKE